MKTLRSILCLMLCIAMLAAGCANKDTGTSDTQESQNSQDSEGSSGDSSEDSSEIAYDENGVSPEKTFPIVKESITLKIMMPSSTSIEDMSTNDFTLWYEDLTNIKVDWNVVPQDSLTDKVNISLSSGDMPDVYMNCGVTQTQQMVYGTMGAFTALNDYIDEYSTMFQDIESKVSGLESIITLPDGNIYALPYIEKCVHCENSSKMWINTAWLKALGVETPETVEEFEELLKQFKEKDPNGNGENDEIPLLSFEGGWQSSVLSGYLTDPFVYTSPDDNYVYLQNGQVMLSYMQDGWKDAMVWLHSLYDQGLLYDQSLIINQDQARQVATSEDGLAVVGCFTSGTPNAVPGDDVESWKDYVAMAPLEGPAGRVATWKPYSSITPTNFVITSACENPAAAFRWGVEQYDRDINLRKVFGLEDVQWKRITPGEGDVPEDAVDLNTGNPSELAMFADGVQWGDEQNVVWRANGPRVETPDAPEYRYNQYQIGDYETNMEYRLAYDTRDNYQPYNPDIEVCLPPLVFDDAQSAELANNESVVFTYVKEMAARFITGDADIEAEWNAYLQELDVKGVQTMTDIYQAAYDAKN